MVIKSFIIIITFLIIIFLLLLNTINALEISELAEIDSSSPSSTSSSTITTFKKVETILKYIFSIIDTNDFILTSITFYFQKYSQEFNNFRLISPITETINITQDEKDQKFFYIKNLTLDFFVDRKTNYFSNHKELLEKSIIIELYFNEIKFELENNYNYLTLISTEVSSLYLSSNNKIDCLDYFNKFFKEYPSFYKVKSSNAAQEGFIDNSRVFFINVLKNALEQKVNKLFISINLLTYDVLKIFGNTMATKLNCSEEIKTNYNFSYFNITQISINKVDINLDKEIEKVVIEDAKFYGFVWSEYLEEMIYFYFNKNDDERLFSLINKYYMINFNRLLIFCGDINNNYPQIKDGIKDLIQIDYYNVFVQKTKEYLDLK